VRRSTGLATVKIRTPHRDGSRLCKIELCKTELCKTELCRTELCKTELQTRRRGGGE